MSPSETAAGLEYAAMYRVEDEDAHTGDLINEAKLRWVADVIALDCRPAGTTDPVIELTEASGHLWVKVTAPVTRKPESAWPAHKVLHSTAKRRKAA